MTTFKKICGRCKKGTTKMETRFCGFCGACYVCLEIIEGYYEKRYHAVDGCKKLNGFPNDNYGIMELLHL